MWLAEPLGLARGVSVTSKQVVGVSKAGGSEEQRGRIAGRSQFPRKVSKLLASPPEPPPRPICSGKVRPPLLAIWVAFPKILELQQAAQPLQLCYAEPVSCPPHPNLASHRNTSRSY